MARYGSYQAALYTAQHEAGSGRVWTDIRQVRDYVGSLIDSDEFQADWPDVFVVNVERRGSGATWSLACSETDTIFLADLSQRVVLHEIAHLCANRDSHGHGPEFARAFLLLVRREMGFHAYGAFLSALSRTDAFRGCDLTPTCEGV